LIQAKGYQVSSAILQQEAKGAEEMEILEEMRLEKRVF
jgi:hypothetical protein